MNSIFLIIVFAGMVITNIIYIIYLSKYYINIKKDKFDIYYYFNIIGSITILYQFAILLTMGKKYIIYISISLIVMLFFTWFIMVFNKNKKTNKNKLN